MAHFSKSSEKVLQALLASMGEAVVIVDPDDRTIQYCNAAAEQLFGYEKHQMVGESTRMLHIDDEHHRRFGEKSEGVLEKGERFEGEFQMKRKDGQIIDTHHTVTPIHEDLGWEAGVVSIIRDITKNRKAFRREKKLKEMFYRALDMAPLPVLMRNENHDITYVNKAFQRRSGYRPDDIKTVGDWADKALPQFSPNSLKKKAQKVFTQEGFLEGGEFTVQTKDGEERIWNFSAANLGVLPGEQQQTAVVMASEVTELRQAEEAHKKKERELRSLFSNLPGMAYRCKNNRNYTMHFVSKGCTALTEYEPEEIVYDNEVAYGQLIHPDDRDYVWNNVQEALQQNSHFEIEYRIHTRSGKEKWVWERGKSLEIGENGNIILQGFISDVTKRKDRKQELERLLKQKNILIQEIHHRVKNNMAIVSGLLDLQKDRLTDSKAIDALEDSQLRIHTMANVHKQLYNEKELSNIKSKDYIEKMMHMHQDFYQGSNIRLESSIQSFVLNVNQAVPLGLLLNELLTNAYQHAFPDDRRGTINIHLTQEGDEVHAKVADDGQGMDMQSTKNPETMGFTIINTLKKQLGADMEIDTGKQGTSVHVSFKKLEPRGSADNLPGEFM